MHIGFNKKTIKGITHLTIPAFEDTGVVNHLFLQEAAVFPKAR